MKNPLKSLFAAIGLLVLGSMFLAPVTVLRKKAMIDPQGHRIMVEKSEAEIWRGRMREFRINWPAYVCFTGAAVAFGWTVFLLTSRFITLVKAELQRDDHEDVD